MKNITRCIWDRDLTVKKWSALNGFNYYTVVAVIGNARGQWRAGKSKKIREALINQGFAVEADFTKEAGK